jgi:hypothetical protein
MPSTTPKPKFLELPSQRPSIQREYTSSPSDRHICTPRTPHGFIPLGTSSPHPTPSVAEVAHRTSDYFSLPKKETSASPDAVKYESHGFIPLCSVAVVQKGDEAKDYFSHSPHIAETSTPQSGDASATSSAAVPYEAHGFIPLCSIPPVNPNDEARDYFSHTYDENVEDTHEGESTSHLPSAKDPASSPASDPSLPLSVPTPEIPIADFTPSTGSPLPSRDTLPFPGAHSTASGTSTPHDLDFHEDRGDKLKALKTNDEAVGECLAHLERTVGLWQGPGTATRRDVECKSSSENWVPAYSGSEYSRDTDDGDGVGDAFCESSGDEEQGDDGNDDEDSNINDDDDDDDDDAAANASEFTEWHAALLKQSADDNDVLLPNHTAQAPETMDDLYPYPHPGITDTSYPAQTSASPIRSPQSTTPNRPYQTISSLLRQPFPTPPPTHTLFKTASLSRLQTLASLLHSPSIPILNATTREVYAAAVPLGMVLYFCGKDMIAPLLSPLPVSAADAQESSSLTEPSSEPTELRIPDSAADALGVARVVRFMRRCCMPTSHASSSDMRVPPSSLPVVLSTYRACRVFGLRADARRIARVTLRTSALGVEHVDLVWSSGVRDSEFGDAVVWLALHELQRDGEGEVAWMLRLGDYGALRQRVESEVRERVWRGETRDEFLARCGMERERRERKAARLERMEEDRQSRIEQIRRENKQRKERDDGTREKAEDTDKATSGVAPSLEALLKGYVPTPEEQRRLDATTQVYAEFLAPSIRRRGSDALLQASDVGGLVERPAGGTAAREHVRTAPVPKKKPSLWEWLKSEMK